MNNNYVEKTQIGIENLRKANAKKNGWFCLCLKCIDQFYDKLENF